MKTALLEKELYRNGKALGEPANVLLAQFAFPAQDFGCDAGRAKDVEHVLLPQVMLIHQEPNRL